MNQEVLPKITLLLSLLIHSAVLISLPYIKHIPQKKELTNLEVTYLRHVAEMLSNKDSHGISKQMLSIEKKELPKTDLPQDKPQIKDIFKFDFSKLLEPKETITIAKPQPKIESGKVKKINLKNLPVETSQEPAYLSYSEIIRKKIQDKAYYYADEYFFFDNPREGKVFVTFTVTSQGQLKEFLILEDKSTKDLILQKIVRLAIENASPFQKFPPDLKYDERTFNQEISFELE